MALFNNKKRNNTSALIEQAIQDKLDLQIFDYTTGLDLLVDFFKMIRPRRAADIRRAEASLYEAAAMLDEHPALSKNIHTAILSQLINTDLVPALTESGSLLSKGFSQEFAKRINQKFLPALQSPKDFLFVINRIFYRKNDYLWVENISNEAWGFLFKSIGIEASQNNVALRKQLLAALEILSYRMVNQGLDPDMIRYMPEEYNGSNPFVDQNLILLKLIDLYNTKNDNEYLHELAFRRLKDAMALASKCLEETRELQRVHGASLSLTYSTLVIEFCLKRMKILIDGIDNDQQFQTARFVNFFKELVHSEKLKNSLRALFSQSFGYVAYQIAVHKGYKGVKYITTTWKEYMKMIVASMWGGLIICFVAIFKSIMGFFHMPPFLQGIAYSINYAIGFVAIEETHSSLATKQPAFTASAVASSFDTKKSGDPNLYQLAVTVGKVFRSQAASFFGNLLVVFPGTYLLAYLYDVITGNKLVSGSAAYKMLEDQHPLHSLSLLYACNTGIFLFLSGIIAGYVQNRMQFGRVGKRIEQHPLLRANFKTGRLAKWGNYVEHHSGALIGNICLGFFLGMSNVVPKIFGIYFDIRHITISSANVSIGAYGLGLKNIPPDYLLVVILGVLGIGFFNFAVSFILAFIVAVRSRGVQLKDYPQFFRVLTSYFFMNPLNFIIPPRSKKSERILQRIARERDS